MGQLNADLSPGLWRPLQHHAETTREPVTHVVSPALTDYLQLSQGHVSSGISADRDS